MYNKTELIEILKSIPWFLEFNQKQLESLANLTTFATAKEGETIFVEGGQLDNVCIILSGEVDVFTTVPSRGCVHVYYGEPLDIIGWSRMTPMVRQRTASVVALTETRLLVLNGDELTELCERDHHVGYVIMKRLANVVASNVLMFKLHLMEEIVQTSNQAIIE
jgi:CRP/FNR family cyclic AMP-dependent transcriptional regulator